MVSEFPFLACFPVCRSWALFAFVVGAFLNQLSATADEISLAYTVEPRSEAIEADEPLIVDVTLANNGQVPVTVYWPRCPG